MQRTATIASVLLALATDNPLAAPSARIQKRHESTTCVDKLTPGALEKAMTIGPETCGSGDTITCPAAHPFIVDALNQFGWASCESVAYYISYISLESVSLAHVTNVYPGRPGQGTYSMMMPNNLAEFVKANPDNPNIPAETYEFVDNAPEGEFDMMESADEDPERAERLNTFREPLLKPEVAFLPAAWYYSAETTISKCKGSLDKMMTADGVREVLEGCTGISGDEAIAERVALWEGVLAVLEGGESPDSEAPKEKDAAEAVEPGKSDTSEPVTEEPANPDGEECVDEYQ